jgi:hypothetical protein
MKDFIKTVGAALRRDSLKGHRCNRGITEEPCDDTSTSNALNNNPLQYKPTIKTLLELNR